MKNNVLFLLILMFNLCSFFALHGQELNANTFDFWVGEWQLSWDKGDGTKANGTNTIVRVLDQKVIQENFNDPVSGFKGMSLSVYNAKTNTWHQAWADNNGGYYDFIGAIDNGQKVFKTKPIQQGEKTIIQRMVFKDITKDSLIWDWESTLDGGEHWKLLWRISYRRKKP